MDATLLFKNKYNEDSSHVYVLLYMAEKVNFSFAFC